MLARNNAHNPNLHALFNARRADTRVRPYGESDAEIVSGTDGIRAARIGAVQGAPAWHGEYQTRADGLWGKVRNNDARAICYSTPEYALAAARLYRDEELVRHEAAFGQDYS